MTGRRHTIHFTAGILCAAVIFLSGCSAPFITHSGGSADNSVQMQAYSAASADSSVRTGSDGIDSDSADPDSVNTLQAVSIGADVDSVEEEDSVSVNSDTGTSAADDGQSGDGQTGDSQTWDSQRGDVDADQQNSGQVQLLCEQIQEEIISDRTAAGEQWSVSCIDLSDGSEASLNGDASMLSASDLKLFIMAALYEAVDEGSADPSLLSYVSEMITVSSNDAANTIVKGLGGGDASAGEQVINAYCQNNGYTATHMGRLFLETPSGDDNYTSSDDCVHLLQKIYLGQCVSEEASAEMLGYLKQQTRTGKIPAGLAGTGAVTANKTGELAGDGLGYAENDCAIIYGSGKDYILCVFSNDIGSSSEAITAIQKISRLAWDTLENA